MKIKEKTTKTIVYDTIEIDDLLIDGSLMMKMIRFFEKENYTIELEKVDTWSGYCLTVRSPRGSNNFYWFDEAQETF